MTHPFAAAIFDLDGTLVDSERMVFAAGVEACRALGHEVDLRFFESLVGLDDRTSTRLIEEHLGETLDMAAFFAEWDRLCARGYEGGIPILPGVVELLDALSAAGLPLALCTSSRRDQAQAKLEATDLLRFFRTVVTVDDVAAPKPAPDPYLLAAQRLGVAPGACLAFEDSETGARSAHAAGMRVVQVHGLHPATGAHAHHVAPGVLQGARLAGLLA